MATLEKVKEAVSEMERAMNEHAKAGASDTEPDGIWQSLLLKALDGRSFNVPRTPGGWDLYSSHPGAEAAAAALFEKASAAVSVVKAASDSREVEKWLRDYCWRC